MSTAIHRWFPPLAGVMLAGCATVAPHVPPVEPPTYQPHLQSVASIHSFELRGRIGVQTDKKGFSGLMHWRHHDAGDDIGFYSPLGNQVGQISADASGVTLTTSDRKTYYATDAEALTEQTMGWGLPLSGLNDWVLGRPAAGAMEILAWDEAGHIARLRQDGWDIEYPQYVETNGRQLPAKIVMNSVKLDLRLVIENWRTNADQAPISEGKE